MGRGPWEGVAFAQHQELLISSKPRLWRRSHGCALWWGWGLSTGLSAPVIMGWLPEQKGLVVGRSVCGGKPTEMTEHLMLLGTCGDILIQNHCRIRTTYSCLPSHLLTTVSQHFLKLFTLGDSTTSQQPMAMLSHSFQQVFPVVHL